MHTFSLAAVALPTGNQTVSLLPGRDHAGHTIRVGQERGIDVRLHSTSCDSRSRRSALRGRPALQPGSGSLSEVADEGSRHLEEISDAGSIAACVFPTRPASRKPAREISLRRLDSPGIERPTTPAPWNHTRPPAPSGRRSFAEIEQPSRGRSSPSASTTRRPLLPRSALRGGHPERLQSTWPLRIACPTRSFRRVQCAGLDGSPISAWMKRWRRGWACYRLAIERR